MVVHRLLMAQLTMCISNDFAVKLKNYFLRSGFAAPQKNYFLLNRRNLIPFYTKLRNGVPFLNLKTFTGFDF